MRLIESLATTDALSAAFSDDALLAGMLRFEAALVRAQADAGLAPPSAADAIARVTIEAFEAAALARAARESGTPAIAFVAALTERVRAQDPAAAAFVHRGATSQDVTDTAMVLCLRDAAGIMAGDQQRLAAALREVSDRHHGTVMLARTLLQPAAPTTFGLRAARWFAGAERGYGRVAAAFEDARVLQLGGPVGTLAAFGEHAEVIAERAAAHLDLAWPGAPWHTERDRFAALVTACAVHTGALAKIARDVALMMQPEIGEASEPGGGSSSMPHKRNPAGCALILAAATRLPGLAAAALSGLANEHERGLGGWHADMLTAAEAVQTSGSALAAAATIVSQLTVDPERMRRNLEAARGIVFPAGGRPDDHLGSAERFRRRLLGNAQG